MILLFREAGKDTIPIYIPAARPRIGTIGKNHIPSSFIFCIKLFSFSALNLILSLRIIAYYILNIYTETFLYPATARKRRKGFIDNSLGSKFLEKPVEGYYTNDGLDLGPYKMIVNCGENCYFTYNIAKAMVPKIIFKNVICCIAFLLIAYWGIKDNLIAIPILQILLSTLFLTELVHHINFIAKLNQLFERFKVSAQFLGR